MKRAIIVFLAVVFLAGVAYAEDTTIEHMCLEFGDLARIIMEKRQEGIPISRMIQVLIDKGDHNARGLVSEIIYMAYEQPNYQVPENQQREITRFADEIFIRCIRANSK